MTSEVVGHKRNFTAYIEPDYAECKEFDPDAIRRTFQEFADSCLDRIPDEGSPADGYMYNAHMGEFFRKLDQAKDEFAKAYLAFHRVRRPRIRARRTGNVVQET